jgi:hypothetical protein
MPSTSDADLTESFRLSAIPPTGLDLILERKPAVETAGYFLTPRTGLGAARHCAGTPPDAKNQRTNQFHGFSVQFSQQNKSQNFNTIPFRHRPRL